jgi:septum formation protein
MSQSKRLILASNSPRRKQLLSESGYTFEVMPADIDEGFDTALHFTSVPVMLAEKKAMALAHKLPNNTVVLAADTIVHYKGAILNKPADSQEAFEMLSKLSGNTHEVVTGVSIAEGTQMANFFDLAEVTFMPLTEAEIRLYIQHFHPFDKAGSYGAQDWIGLIGVQKINGSFFNVMGLPMHLVYQKLKEFGVWPSNWK